MLQFSPRIRVFFRFVFFHWIIFFLFRVVFYLFFSETETGITLETVAKAFYLGAKFDLRAVLWLAMPLVFFSWLPFINFKTNRKFWSWLYTLAAFLWVAVYFTDFGYYAYLNTRVNSSLVSFLHNPIISAEMVWENYPVLKGFFGTLALLYIYNNFLKRYIFRQEFFIIKKSSMANVLGVLVFSLFFIGGLYGKFAYYPLRWSEAFFSPNVFVSNLSLNPLLYLSRTLRHRGNHYDKQFIKDNYALLADYYKVPEKDEEKLNFVRRFPKKDIGIDFEPNVILVVMESFASYKTGLLDNPIDAGPHVTKLAKDGMYFSEYYVPVEGTARSMFALMSGVADLSQYKTASRNPMIVSQNVIMNAFKNYEKYYFLGGSANWGNIRGVFSNNVSGIKIFEEGEYTEDRTDVWGLSDYHLFKEAVRVFNERDQKKPFFAVVQSSSYHRPYTIPKVPGFEELTKTEEELKHAGFISNQEYNSFRFSDYSFGQFIEWAKEQDWYENTLIVVTGDHGVPDNGAPFRVPSRVQLESAPFHVPLVFYNKKLIPKPVVLDKAASEMDVLPTIAGFLGIEYANQAMGRDLLNPIYDDRRFALTYTYHRAGTYGLIGEGYYLKVKPNSRELYLLDNPEGLVGLKEEEPERFEAMSKLADALLEFGKYMLHHNKPIKDLTTSQATR